MVKNQSFQESRKGSASEFGLAGVWHVCTALQRVEGLGFTVKPDAGWFRRHCRVPRRV